MSQFHDNPYGKNSFETHRDKHDNEIPEGGSFRHDNATPKEGSNPNYGGRHYNTDVKPGQNVSGKSSVERNSVSGVSTARGREN